MKTKEKNSEFKLCFSVDHILEIYFCLFKQQCVKEGKGELDPKTERFLVPQTLQQFYLLYGYFIFFSYIHMHCQETIN